MKDEVRYRDGMKQSLVTHPGLDGEPSALPDGPRRRKTDPPPHMPPLGERVRGANDDYNALPRHEQLRLAEGMRVAWILDKLNLPHTPSNQAAVRGVVEQAASERKPRTL